jgi:hypothetical protein
MGSLLRASAVACLALALASVVVPGAGGRVLADMAVATVITIPLLRVLSLVIRWIRERDYPFALAGAGLLTIVGIGFAVALIRA